MAASTSFENSGSIVAMEAAGIKAMHSEIFSTHSLYRADRRDRLGIPFDDHFGARLDLPESRSDSRGR